MMNKINENIQESQSFLISGNKGFDENSHKLESTYEYIPATVLFEKYVCKAIIAFPKNEQAVATTTIIKKRITLDPNAFYGRVLHKDILTRLLNEIRPVDFRELIELPKDEDLKQKHFLFGIVKNLLQIAERKQWSLCKVYDFIYVFNGAFWKQCAKEEMKSFLTTAAVKMGLKEYDARHYEFSEKLFKQFLSDAQLPTPEVDADKILINLRNGTFEFTSAGWKLRDFNPKDFKTYQLPFEYDANAKCPLFEQYLLKALPDESSRMVMQEFSGFIFTSLNLEKCLVLTGPGGNGKSVFFNILNALIGKDNVLNYSLGQFAHEYSRAKLVNILLNYSSEKGFDLHPDTFKALVSGEPLQARSPYGQPFTIYNKVKFIINCNELPREVESTQAYFRRFLIVPFDTKITDAEKDIDLADKIIDAELPGVFNWLLAGLDRIIAQKDFTKCDRADMALAEFRKQSDSVQLFIEEIHLEPSATLREALTDLYGSYKEFCKEDNYKPLGKNRFSQRLERKGFVKTRLNKGDTGFYVERLRIEEEAKEGIKNLF